MSSATGLSVLDKFFIVLKAIENSDKPLSILEIVVETGFSIRTVQRFACRLAQEGLVGFRVQRTEQEYDRVWKDIAYKTTRRQSGYEYFKVGSVL